MKSQFLRETLTLLEKMKVGGRDILVDPKTGRMFDARSRREIPPPGGGSQQADDMGPDLFDGAAGKKQALPKQSATPNSRPKLKPQVLDDADLLFTVESEDPQYRVNSVEDIVRGSKIPYVHELGKRPKGYEVYKKLVESPNEVPEDLKFVYRGVRKMPDGHLEERKFVTSLHELSKSPPPDIFKEGATSAEQTQVMRHMYQEIWGVIKDDPRYTLREKAHLTHLGAMKEYRLEKAARDKSSLDAPIDGTEGLTLGEAMPSPQTSPERAQIQKDLSAKVQTIVKRAEKKAGRPISLDEHDEILRNLSNKDKSRLYRLLQESRSGE